MSWEAGEREPRVTVGVALAKALGFEDITVLYLDFEPKLNQAGQQRLGNTDPCCCTRQSLPKTGADTAFAAGLFTARLCRYRSVAGR